MRINKVQFKNFKRFANLTLDNIPANAKLVLLIGANGSGKSSVFDGFHYVRMKWSMQNDDYTASENAQGYCQKISGTDIEYKIEFNNGESIVETNFKSAQFLDKLIGRSSIRILPRLHNNGDPSKIENDNDGPETFIENDTRFVNDVFMYFQQIDNALREPVFQGKSADTLKIFHDLISPFNESQLFIFGMDLNTTIQIAKYQNATPFSPGQLIFKKGETEINYDLLSHGEKQVVILLLNFIVRQEYYEDAIIFIDEMDCHLNTALQSRLLEEIVTKWIPDSSQLWTASHALGFIDYAKKSDDAAILDFDNLNFDVPQVIGPESKDSIDVYEIAVPKETIATILSGKKLVVAENKDSALFNLALGEKSYLFLPANNNREVFLTVKGQKHLSGLRDRDFLRNDEIAVIKEKFPNFKILHYYTFENYLYHPDNLAELNWAGFDMELYKQEITKRKNNALIEIISGIGVARTTYVEFKEGITNDGVLTDFTNALQSDDFETFYVFLNMKKHFDKSVLNKYKYEQKDLVKTAWFKNKIESILTLK